MSAAAIIKTLKGLADKNNQEGMKRFAVGDNTALGIKLPVLRDLAKPYKKQHALALDLWNSGIHEARLMACFIDDPKQVNEEQMDAWTRAFYSWDICDQCCANLFQKTPYFLEKAFAYSHAEEEFVKRTGFVLMIQYAVHHKKAPDEQCLEFLTRIEEEAWDERNFVKKALNWCLRQIGKRSAWLYPKAVACAERIAKQPHRSARWIASDALRELNSEAVRTRIGI
ncbi:MAG TPA: DNA alkylation repair protein [Chitinophagaceae bacterium]|nr:DNA alkylation repair protein [Chitinophagaceae bacterium]